LVDRAKRLLKACERLQAADTRRFLSLLKGNRGAEQSDRFDLAIDPRELSADKR
jgi:hypothetical protein